MRVVISGGGTGVIFSSFDNSFIFKNKGYDVLWGLKEELKKKLFLSAE